MKKVILVRYGEIILKGLNRPVFEDKLVKNIRRAIYGLGKVEIIKSQARIFIEPEEDNYDFEAAVSKIIRVFGIVSVSIVLKTESNFDKIKEHCLMLAKEKTKDSKSTVTFKVEAKRGDKKFPMKSPEICAEIGAYLLENLPVLKVDVNDPDFIMYIEVRESTFIYCDIIPSYGGLPIGTNGKAMLLLSGGIDSPVAGWMMAKRGMEIEAVHFYSYPYTSERAKEKVISLAKIMSEYCYRIKLHIVPFTDIQLEINDKAPYDQITVVMRRVMMKIAQMIAEKEGCHALITGESLGQVASQTVQALAVTNAAVQMPVLRPLIGMDKNEVIEIARKIGTFETSILPYEDCCTVFVAKHPKTKPKLKEILEIEEKLELDELIEKAIKDTEIMEVME